MSNSNGKNGKNGVIAFLFANSLFLIGGSVSALVWANLDASRGTSTYESFLHYDLLQFFGGGTSHAGGDGHDGGHADNHGAVAQTDAAKDSHSGHEEAGHEEAGHEEAGHDHGSGGESGQGEAEHEPVGAGGHPHGLSLFFLVNDVLMALFFAIAAKEVWEAMLPGGALANPRKAATPLLATAGGVIGPALVYLAGVYLTNRGDLGRGWAVPCATDIAFSYMVARIVFGNGHPAINFLLLLAIADDAAGLAILAVFYPNPAHPIAPQWFALTAAAIGLCFAFRKARLHSFWFYLLVPGTMSWFGFYFAGLHPALGLVPVIPCFPHAHTDLGLFAREELKRHDTLSEFEHFWKNPVELILGLFGLCNAGVTFGAVGTGTWLVLSGLLIGKPLGITLMTLFAERVLGLQIPGNMSYRHIISIGMVAAIGFTVALFVSTAAFPVPPSSSAVQQSVKMGALASLLAGLVAIIGARMLGVRPLASSGAGGNSHADDEQADLPEETKAVAVPH